MADKNSVSYSNSRYVAGGTTEVSANRLEWFERNVLLPADDDTFYVVEKKFAHRIDLIAASQLGDSTLWWVIAMLNNILDPYNEIAEGRVLQIPSADRLSTLTTGKTGGVPSTREVPLAILPIV